MRPLLLPSGTPRSSGAAPDEDVLAAYAYPPLGEAPCWLRANMVATVDGAATGPDGRSGSISSGADRRLFHHLRGLCDALLVGAGTARTENYRPLSSSDEVAAARAASGQAPRPTLVVVSRALRLEPDLRMFSGPDRVVVVTSRAAPAAAADALAVVADVVRTGDDEVDLHEALDLLAGRGLRLLLCEGGPSLLGDLVADGLLDELCLTVAPVALSGTAPRAAHGRPAAVPVSLEPAIVVLADDGSLLTSWRRPLAGPAPLRPTNPRP
jgi:riboflavin-specific deaminase-like protein